AGLDLGPAVPVVAGVVGRAAGEDRATGEGGAAEEQIAARCAHGNDLQLGCTELRSRREWTVADDAGGAGACGGAASARFWQIVGGKGLWVSGPPERRDRELLDKHGGDDDAAVDHPL